MKVSLFFSEEKIIKETTSIFESIDQLKIDKIKKGYKTLFKSYKTLFKQFRRLIKLSDKQQLRLRSLNEALEIRNLFIKKTFGRYLSDDIVDTLLETPDGLKLGGERRVVTIMMTDLRGFTALCETLSPEDVLTIINTYLETMTEVILKYNGTIDEIIGDGLFVIFGAPIQNEDDAKRSVACAIEMQMAMDSVNQRMKQMGFPKLALGIGLNTGVVVVGNIGSNIRTKYGIIGSNVNLTARIESYTVGGQIFISENTLNACENLLRIDNILEVLPKGVAEPMNIYEIGGIGDPYNLFLPEKNECQLTPLNQKIDILICPIKSKHVSDDQLKARIIQSSRTECIIECDAQLDAFLNIKMFVFDSHNNLITQDLYAKVGKSIPGKALQYKLSFTSMPKKIKDYLIQCTRI